MLPTRRSTTLESRAIIVDGNPSLPSNAFEMFNEMRRTGQLCDVKIVSDGKTLNAHRVILSVIPFFRSMFTLDLLESNNEVVNIPQISYETLEQIVQFIYTNQILITTLNVQSVMIGAHFLQMIDLITKCELFMIEQLDATNCLSVRRLLTLFGTNNCNEALNEYIEYIAAYFVKLTKDNTFTQLDVNDMIELLTLDNLYVNSEEDVYQCALKWLETDESRHVYASDILECVRLSLINKQFLETAATHPIFALNTKCQQLILDVMYSFETQDESTTSICMESARHSEYFLGFLIVIPICSNLIRDNAVRYGEIYNPHTAQWTVLNNMEFDKSLFSVVTDNNNQIYVIGGKRREDEALKGVHRYDSNTNQWIALTQLREGRYGASAVFVNNKIYVMGGYDRNNNLLLTMEVMDIDKNIWESGVDMKRRHKVAVTALDGYIYVCGGHDDNDVPLGLVERFNTETRVWEEMKPMKNKKSGIGITTRDGKIYCIGGKARVKYVKTAEFYNVEQNKWFSLPNMRYVMNDIVLMATHEGILAIEPISNRFEKYRNHGWVTGRLGLRQDHYKIAICNYNIPPQCL